MIGNKEVLVYANTAKRRIPMAPAGVTHKSLKDRIRTKRNKITIDNWDRI